MQNASIPISHTASYVVRTSEIDQHKKLTVPALFQLMHETAMQHVLQLKLSVWDLESSGMAWILMRQKTRIHSLPKLGDSIRIFTYPSGFEKLFTYRDYYVYNEQGDCLAEATTTWLLMDTQSRRAVKMPENIAALLSGQGLEIPYLTRCDNRLPPFSKPKLIYTPKAGWFDLDFNDHLNNVVYVKWMLESLSEDFLRSHSIKDFQIHYKLEVGPEEILHAEIEALGNNEYLHRLSRSSDGKETAIAHSIWS